MNPFPDLPDRVAELLVQGGISSPRQLLFCDKWELLRIKGIGPETIKLIRKSYSIFHFCSLDEQAKILNIPITDFQTRKAGRGWISPISQKELRPEEVVLEFFRREGWKGVALEGYPVRLLQDAACQEFINEKTKGERLPFFFDRHVWIACKRGKREDFIEPVARIDETSLRKNLKLIISYHLAVGTYGDSIRDIEYLIRIWKILGPEIFKKIMQAQVSTEGYPLYYNGWPDLTLTKGDELLFVEVKTSDKIQGSQLDLIMGLLRPLNLPFKIARLRQPRD